MVDKPKNVPVRVRVEEETASVPTWGVDYALSRHDWRSMVERTAATMEHGLAKQFGKETDSS